MALLGKYPYREQAATPASYPSALQSGFVCLPVDAYASVGRIIEIVIKYTLLGYEKLIFFSIYGRGI